jgi:hypothetical protein
MARATLLALVDEAFDRKAWHGTTLFGSLRGVSAATAAWRPGPLRHNIWEIAVHAAYWKYAVRRLLTGEKRGSFALKGSNWFEKPGDRTAPALGSVDREWANDVKALSEEHRRLREAIERFPEAALSKRLKGKAYDAAFTIRGIACHDLYHAGQIQLLKKLAAGHLSRENAKNS